MAPVRLDALDGRNGSSIDADLSYWPVFIRSKQPAKIDIFVREEQALGTNASTFYKQAC
jgi:hypothetical protein